jgi:hypothetical protein
MKKFFAIAIIAASFTACNNSGDKTESKDSSATVAPDTTTMAPDSKMSADTSKMAPMDTTKKKDTSAKK